MSGDNPPLLPRLHGRGIPVPEGTRHAGKPAEFFNDSLSYAHTERIRDQRKLVNAKNVGNHTTAAAYNSRDMSVIKMPTAAPKLRRSDRDIGAELRALLEESEISLDAAAKACGLKGASSFQTYTKEGRFKPLRVDIAKKLVSTFFSDKPEIAAKINDMAGIPAGASDASPNLSIAAQIQEIERMLDSAQLRINSLRKELRGD
jgi:hypothetical protein